MSSPAERRSCLLLELTLKTWELIVLLTDVLVLTCGSVNKNCSLLCSRNVVKFNLLGLQPGVRNREGVPSIFTLLVAIYF